MDNEMIRYILSIVSGILACIPLVYKIVAVVQENVKAKKWDQIVAMASRLMVEAETKFDNGVDRKAWVIAMIEASAKTVECPIDMRQVSDLIDALCAMSKVVNNKASAEVV